MSKAIIEVNGLASGYVKGLNILQGVDLVLKEKEIVSIIGPNGAGKSTLLKAIMGIIPVFGGKIFLRQDRDDYDLDWRCGCCEKPRLF